MFNASKKSGLYKYISLFQYTCILFQYSDPRFSKRVLKQRTMMMSFFVCFFFACISVPPWIMKFGVLSWDETNQFELIHLTMSVDQTVLARGLWTRARGARLSCSCGGLVSFFLSFFLFSRIETSVAVESHWPTLSGHLVASSRSSFKQNHFKKQNKTNLIKINLAYFPVNYIPASLSFNCYG